MRLFPAALAVMLALACPALAQSNAASDNRVIPGYNSGGVFVPYGAGQAVTPSVIVITQTVVTLSAATSTTLVAANVNRKYLCWMDVGTAPFTAAPGLVTVTAGNGMNYDPGSSASNQGGTFCQEGVTVSQQAFSAISTVGTKVTVWEGQ
jgi:hypothetical protein